MDAKFLREHIPHPYQSLDEQGVIQVVNEAWLDLLGYDRGAVEGEPFADFLTPESRTAFETAFPELLRQGATSDVEFEMRRADGDTLIVRFDGTVESRNGSVRTHCQFTDITDSERRKAELRRANTVVETLIENLPFGVLVEDTDREIILANETFTDILDLDVSAEALVGMDCGRAAEQAKALFVDPEGFIGRIRTLLERRERVLNEELRLKDGRFLERSYVPYTLPDGVANFWIYRDITDRRRREIQMRKSQEIGDIGWWSRPIPDGEIRVSENLYEMWDIDETAGPVDHEKFVGQVHPEDREHVAAEWEAAKAGEPYDVEHRIVTDDGVKWMHQRAELTFDEAGDPVDATGVIQDITGRKRIETELEEQRDDLAVLNELLRHDVRNDLQLISGYTEVLDVEPGSESHRQQILEAADHAVNLTKTARDLSETLLHSGRGLEPISLKSVVESEVEEQRETFESATIEIAEPFPDVRIEADPRLESVVRNLLTNAVQHNPDPNPTVRVAATATDSTVTVRVADDGPGIEADRQEQIFEQGYTGTESTGTGLGLHLVSTLVERYDGSITVGDADLGGAVFALTFPTLTD